MKCRIAMTRTCCYSQRKDGTEKGPQALRDGGLIESLKRIGCEITDRGDVNFGYLDEDAPQGNVKNPRNVALGSLRVGSF